MSPGYMSVYIDLSCFTEVLEFYEWQSWLISCYLAVGVRWSIYRVDIIAAAR